MARSKKADTQEQTPKQSTFNNLEAKLARQREIERGERVHREIQHGFEEVEG
jgi:hypothetical protein